jgi:hypothetical protein
LACPQRYQLSVIEQYPGGVYQERDPPILGPSDSLLYDDFRVNPWDAGTGFFGQLNLDFCDTDPLFEGNCSLAVHFDENNFADVKFMHQFGLDTRHFKTLNFWIFLTGSGTQNFKIFTTAARSDCDP